MTAPAFSPQGPGPRPHPLPPNNNHRLRVHRRSQQRRNVMGIRLRKTAGALLISTLVLGATALPAAADDRDGFTDRPAPSKALIPGAPTLLNPASSTTHP